MAKRSKIWLLAALVLLLGLAATSWRSDDAPATDKRKGARILERSAVRQSASVDNRAVYAAVAEAMVAAAEQAKETEPLRMRIREVVGTFTDLARAHLYEGPSGQAYRKECTALESGRCKELFTAAAHEVLAWHVDAPMLAGELGAGEINAADSEVVHSEAAKLLERSTDPLERVCMLELLKHSTKLRPVAFPSEVYRGLSDKPVVEAQLLLSRSVLTGLPDEVTIQEVATLARAEMIDPRVQGMALASLATPSTAALLNSAVRTLTAAHEPEWAGWSSDVAPALGRCGAACTDVAVEVVAGAADSQSIAVRILHLTRPRDRRELLTRLSPALSADVIAQLKESMEI